MTFDPVSLKSYVLITTAFSAAFLAALWLSLIFWTYRDIKKRSSDPLLRILAILVVAALFLPGIIIYMVLRPQNSIEDEYQRTLEEEALLQSIEDKNTCPGCSRQIEDNWLVCPGCHTRLKKVCHNCKRLINLSWDICPYCGIQISIMNREQNGVQQKTVYPQESDPMSGFT